MKREKTSCDFTDLLRWLSSENYLCLCSLPVGPLEWQWLAEWQTGIKERPESRGCRISHEMHELRGPQTQTPSHFVLTLKEQRKHSEVPTASMKYVLLWYLSSSSCRVLLGRMEDFLHRIPCADITGRPFPSMQHQWEQLSALIYTRAPCQRHAQGAT